MSVIVRVRKREYGKMLAHCMEGLPGEACGLLAGTVEGDIKTVEKVYLLANVADSRERFAMDPAEQVAAQKDARAKGMEIIGNFHSHPEAPARLSREDRRMACNPSMEYMVVSLQDVQAPVLKAFGIDGEGCVAAHEVEIME